MLKLSKLNLVVVEGVIDAPARREEDHFVTAINCFDYLPARRFAPLTIVVRCHHPQLATAMLNLGMVEGDQVRVTGRLVGAPFNGDGGPYIEAEDIECVR